MNKLQQSWKLEAGKKQNIFEERIILESIGFNRVSEFAFNQQTWDDMFEEPRLFKAKR